MERRMTAARIGRVVLAGLALALFVACGGGGGDDGGGGGADASDARSGGDGGGGGTDAAAPGDSGGTADVPLSCDGPCYDITFDGEGPIEVPNGQARTIGVRVVHHGTDAPADGVHLRLRLSGPVDGASRISAESVFTGADGRAEVTFRADEVAPPVAWLLIASAAGSADASLEIEVVPGASGRITVALGYDGTRTLDGIEVRVAGGEVSCADIDPATLPETTVAATLPGDATTAEFEGLPGDARYAVVAAASGSMGGASHLVAYACEDGVEVAAGATTTVRLDLLDIRLTREGTYDASLTLDLGEALPAADLATLDELGAAAAADDIYGDIARRVRAAHAAGAEPAPAPASLDTFEQALAAAFLAWRDEAAPSWVAAAPFGADAAAILSATSLTGTLALADDPERPTFVEGVSTWASLSVPTDPACLDEACARRNFTVAQLAAATTPFALEPAGWTGVVVEGDRLTVNTHRVPLDTGALTRIVLDQVLLAGAGLPPTGLRGAVAAWPDCAAVAARVDAATLQAVGASAAVVQTLCRQVADVELEDALDALDAMAEGGDIRLTGTARLSDPDNDLAVDAIVEGAVSGQAIDADDVLLGPLGGTWRATRQ